MEGLLRGHLGSRDPEVEGGQDSRRSLSLSSLPPLVGQALGQVHSCWDLGGPQSLQGFLPPALGGASTLSQVVPTNTWVSCSS